MPVIGWSFFDIEPCPFSCHLLLRLILKPYTALYKRSESFDNGFGNLELPAGTLRSK